MDHTSHIDTPLGTVLLSSDGDALTGLWFEGQKFFGSTLSDEHIEQHVPVLEQTELWLRQYFSGKEPDFTPPLSPAGTPFQKTVWDLLLTIPYGHIVTYGDIAAEIAKERGVEHFSSQAVGNAVARNPISIIIPCHRVIGADGTFTGYAGGLERKKKLLSIEGSLLNM